jgi:hypothetical protein
MKSNPNIPNTTQVPNYVLDVMMSCLSGAEFKVLMFFIRQTYGFMKYNHKVSYSLNQISKGMKSLTTGEYIFHGTGVSTRQVQSAIDKLNSNYELITVEYGDFVKAKATKYKLNLDADIAEKILSITDEQSRQKLPRQKLPCDHGNNCHDTTAKIAISGNQEKPIETKIVPTAYVKFKESFTQLLQRHNINTKAYVWSVYSKIMKDLAKDFTEEELIACLPFFEVDKWAKDSYFAFHTFKSGLVRYLRPKEETLHDRNEARRKREEMLKKYEEQTK